MFMKINPLDAAAASKNKSKDIHLTSIDVNFGSNRILYVDALNYMETMAVHLVVIVSRDHGWRETRIRSRPSPPNSRIAQSTGRIHQRPLRTIAAFC